MRVQFLALDRVSENEWHQSKMSQDNKSSRSNKASEKYLIREDLFLNHSTIDTFYG